jgi:hypothetical protein
MLKHLGNKTFSWIFILFECIKKQHDMEWETLSHTLTPSTLICCYLLKTIENPMCFFFPTASSSPVCFLLKFTIKNSVGFYWRDTTIMQSSSFEIHPISRCCYRYSTLKVDTETFIIRV